MAWWQPAGEVWHFRTFLLDIYLPIFRAPAKGRVYAGHGNMRNEHDTSPPKRVLTGRKERSPRMMIHCGTYYGKITHTVLSEGTGPSDNFTKQVWMRYRVGAFSYGSWKKKKSWKSSKKGRKEGNFRQKEPPKQMCDRVCNIFRGKKWWE